MEESATYTHAEWRVRPGREAEFISAWEALAAIFRRLPRPPLWGTLLRSSTELTLFYSFGPWRSAADVMEMRADEEVQAAFAALQALCESMRPGMYEVVRHVAVGARGAGPPSPGAP